MSYYSGGSGYVLSRAAFTRLMTEGLLLPGPRRCAMPHSRADGISNYPPEWYSINEDVQVIIYKGLSIYYVSIFWGPGTPLVVL